MAVDLYDAAHIQRKKIQRCAMSTVLSRKNSISSFFLRRRALRLLPENLTYLILRESIILTDPNTLQTMYKLLTSTKLFG